MIMNHVFKNRLGYAVLTLGIATAIATPSSAHHASHGYKSAGRYTVTVHVKPTYRKKRYVHKHYKKKAWRKPSYYKRTYKRWRPAKNCYW